MEPLKQPGALSGLRVVDLTQMLAGPFCTQILADHGADVVKIETLKGDGTRPTGPFRDDDTLRDFGGYFQSVNRNKRSIAVDLKTTHGCAAVRKLIDGADIAGEYGYSAASNRWRRPRNSATRSRV